MKTITRTGKIARLPEHVRSELNRRLQDGEPGNRLVGWLNGLKEVQDVLAGQFEGRAVTESNLSGWKKGGYQDWLRHQELPGLAARLPEWRGGLAGAVGGMETGDRLAGALSIEFAALSRQLLEEKMAPAEKWECLHKVLQELSQLRRDNHGAVRTLIKREVWGRQVNMDGEERKAAAEKKRRDELCAPFWTALKLGAVSEAFGGGKTGRDIAAHILEVQNDLPPDSLRERVREQIPSNPVQADSSGLK